MPKQEDARSPTPTAGATCARPRIKMPVNSTMDRRSRIPAAPFEVGHKYHSQGLASGGSALLDAVNKGKVHLAKFILDADDSDDAVNTRDFKGKTPLIRACYIKEEKTRGRTVDLLITKGADVNVQDDYGRTALSYACELRCNNVVRKLVRHSGDPDIADNKGNTPLTYSAMVGNDVAVDILVRCFRRLGLQVDHVNQEGMTALLIAAKLGYVECAYTLALEGRANITYRDPERALNAEEFAREQGCSTPEVMPFSVQGQAMLKAKNNRLQNKYELNMNSDEFGTLDYLREIYYKECAGLGGVEFNDTMPSDEGKRQNPMTSSEATMLPSVDIQSKELRPVRRRSLPVVPFRSSPEVVKRSSHLDKGKQLSLPVLEARKRESQRELLRRDGSEEECFIEEDITELERWLNKGKTQAGVGHDKSGSLPELDKRSAKSSPRNRVSQDPRESGNSLSTASVTTVAINVDLPGRKDVKLS